MHPASGLQRSVLVAVLLSATLFSEVSIAQGASEASRAFSSASIAAPARLVEGSVEMLRGVGQFSVTSVKTVGEVSVLGLQAASTGVGASIEVSAKAIEGSMVAVGTVVVVAGSATGTLISAAGRALMFIPNEVGVSLLHHSRSRDD